MSRSVVEQLKSNHKQLHISVSTPSSQQDDVDSTVNRWYINIACARYRTIMTHTIVWVRHFWNDAATWRCRTRSTVPLSRIVDDGAPVLRGYSRQTSLLTICTSQSQHTFVLYHGGSTEVGSGGGDGGRYRGMFATCFIRYGFCKITCIDVNNLNTVEII